MCTVFVPQQKLSKGLISKDLDEVNIERISVKI